MLDQATVHEEYLIYDLISMIGVIEGTLGLFIGLSFTNFVSVHLRVLQQIARKVRHTKLKVTSSEMPDKQKERNCLVTQEDLSNTVKMIEYRVSEQEDIIQTFVNDASEKAYCLQKSVNYGSVIG